MRSIKQGAGGHRVTRRRDVKMGVMAEKNTATAFSSKKMGIRIEKPEYFKEPLLKRSFPIDMKLSFAYRCMLVMTYGFSISALLIVFVSKF